MFVNFLNVKNVFYIHSLPSMYGTVIFYHIRMCHLIWILDKKNVFNSKL